MVRALRLHTQYRILTKCPQRLTADGEALTRVCTIDYATNKVVHDIRSIRQTTMCDHKLSHSVRITTYGHVRSFVRVITPDFSFSGTAA